MRLSDPAQHLFLVEKGWTHEALNAMAEEEFLYWYDQAAALLKARAEAIRAAQEG